MYVVKKMRSLMIMRVMMLAKLQKKYVTRESSFMLKKDKKTKTKQRNQKNCNDRYLHNPYESFIQLIK